MKKSLKILLTNITLAGFTGTEIVIRDLAIGLKRRGHKIIVYTALKGGVSDEIESAGVRVITDLSLIRRKPDIIHGQHHIQTMQAIMKFPKVPAIFICHDAQSWHDIPPKHPAIQKYVAVDRRCYNRLHLDHAIPKSQICSLYNWLNTERFKAKPEQQLSQHPKRALVFSSYARDNEYLDRIKKACHKLNIELDVVGFGIGKGCKQPEEILANYDLVFAKAKCAIEALGVGAALIVCDDARLAGMVTMDNFEHYKDWNFGRGLMQNELTTSALIEEIQKYNVAHVANIQKLIREKSCLQQSLDNYLKLYLSCIQGVNAKELHQNSDSYSGYARHLLEKIVVLEAQNRPPFPMLPMNEADSAKLSLEAIDLPKQKSANTNFRCKTKIKNNTSLPIGSLYPNPVNLSYHWYKADSPKAYIFEGERSALTKPLAESSEDLYIIGVKAPKEPGEYVLHITLVQEGIRWFNQLPNPVVIKHPMTII